MLDECCADTLETGFVVAAKDEESLLVSSRGNAVARAILERLHDDVCVRAAHAKAADTHALDLGSGPRSQSSRHHDIPLVERNGRVWLGEPDVGRDDLSNWIISGASVLGGPAADIFVSDGIIVDAAPAGADRLDAVGLVALPGLVDLHTHLREPGREDAETVETGSRAAALGGYTAVCAMANTDPVADTAGVVEQVWRLGADAGLVDVQPIGAVTVGLAGERLAELGAMATSAANVRVFSDDGHCVHDPVLMRRALEYVKAFDGVIAQHAEEPRLTAGAQMNEGETSARLGLAGWPAVAEEAIIARDVLLAGHVNSRLHVCHVSTAGSVELIRWPRKIETRLVELAESLQLRYSTSAPSVGSAGPLAPDQAAIQLLQELGLGRMSAPLAAFQGSIEDVAIFLCRSGAQDEVRKKAAAMGWWPSA